MEAAAAALEAAAGTAGAADGVLCVPGVSSYTHWRSWWWWWLWTLWTLRLRTAAAVVVAVAMAYRCNVCYFRIVAVLCHAEVTRAADTSWC